MEFFGELQSNEVTQGIPVVFLTGKTHVSHKITAFSMGADDYIEKPFNALELKCPVPGTRRQSRPTYWTTPDLIAVS